MTTWIALRLLKFTALAALAVGVGLAAGQRRQADRAAAAFGLATPALWLTWLAGYLLLKTTGRGLADPFVGVGVVASLAGLHGAVLAGTRPSPGRVARALGPIGLAVATATMVARDLPAFPAAVAAALAGVAALGLTSSLPAPDGVVDPEAGDRAEAWFLRVARAEGLSFVLMMVVAMPLRRATGLSLDGGTGALGWAHGALVLIYLQALQVVARARGWSARTVVTALVASVVPFGTFAFERVALPGARRVPTEA